MRMKKWSLALVASTLMLSFTVPTSTTSAASIDELKQEQQNIESQKNKLNGDIKEKDTKIDQNTTKLEKLQKKVEKLTRNIKKTKDQVTSTEKKIKKTNKEVDELTASIKKLEQDIKDRDEILRERIRAMQENGGSVNYLDVLLGANSFGDFIDRASAVTTLVDADKEIMQEQADDQKQLEEEKVLIEEKLDQQEKNKKELDQLKKSLEEQKEEQSETMKKLKKEQKKLKTEKEELETELHGVHEISKSLEKEIRAEEGRMAELARQAAEEQKRLEEEAEAAAKAEATSSGKQKPSTSNDKSSKATNKSSSKGKQVSSPSIKAPSVSSGSWTRPAAGRITSEFGFRNIGFATSNHSGIDVGNPVGTPVVAAADGVVQRAQTMGSYGQVIMLKHSIGGKTYTTVYAHLSRFHVSAGQVVKKGQLIGNIGMTGRTSGPHLHFEVHQGGYDRASNSRNPRNFISF